jgi:serine/threonine protein kinase
VIILDFLHEHDVMYRDLKPPNLIFDADGHLCLTDFNFASTTAKHGKHEPLGSPAYTAPEVFKGTYGPAVDWWSFGIVMHHLLVGFPPYRASSIEEMINLIQKTPVNYSEVLDGSSKSFLQLVLDKDEHKRLENAVSKLKSHKFFKNVDWDKVKHKRTASPLSEIEKSK